MQDPAFHLARLPGGSAVAAAAAQFPEQEQLKCPRCESTNTKFCYYNNYNLSQPRHFCKNCRRYWTKGGALRNIPVGGGSRKSSSSSSSAVASAGLKRPSSTSSVSAPAAPKRAPPPPPPLAHFPDPAAVVPGGFSSLLASAGQFEGPGQDSGSDSGRAGDGYWGGATGGWPDLAIYTPGSSYQ